jgi:hypothetical protein
MLKFLSQMLILCCLLGQVVNVFGLPLAIKSNQSAIVSIEFNGCCASGSKCFCCDNVCKCCSSNDLQSDDFEFVQASTQKSGVQVKWLNPVSTKKCNGTNLINQFGVEMVFQEMDQVSFIVPSGFIKPEGAYSPFCGVELSKFKPPQV